MFNLETLVIVFHLLAAVSVVMLVLLQQGKGAETGASFGAGASATVFGSQGSATFFSKVTAILATVFFVTSLSLGYFAKEQARGLSQAGLPDPVVLEVQKKPVAEDVPVLEQNAEGAASSSDVPQAPDEIAQ